jgi:hypothetical protein
MYLLGVDWEHNVLYMKLDGFLEGNELEELVDEFTEKLEGMPASYCMINDLSSFVPPMSQSEEIIAELIKLLNTHAPRTVFRIINHNLAGIDPFLRAGEIETPDYEIINVRTLEEAYYVIAGERSGERPASIQ